MKISFDDKADAIYLTLDEAAKVKDSEEVRPGVVLDFNDKDEVVGIEILNIKHRVSIDKLKQILFEVA